MKTASSLNNRNHKARSFDLLGALEQYLMPTAWIAIGIGVILLLGGLGSTLLGISNVYWYLSRSSALVGYVLLWASMVLGVAITGKLARVWPGGPMAFDLHQYLSILGIGFAVLHVVTLLGDSYIGYSIGQLLLPFGAGSYQPFWVGLGQVATYLLIPVMISFYARKALGPRGWRTIHGLSYLLFGMTLLHGLFSGSDSAALWTTALYWFTGVSLVGLTAYRVVLARLQKQTKAASHVAQAA
jgi:predicted ferric reductase